MTFTIESTIQNIEKSILCKRAISNNPKPYTIVEYLKKKPREALIFVCSIEKGIAESPRENNIPFDFNNCMKKFDVGVFYQSFSGKKIEKNPKDTAEFLDTVIEEINRKPESGDKK